mgnify:FL=1
MEEAFGELIRQVSSLRKEVKAIRKSINDERKPCYSNQEVMEMFGVATQTIKKWRDTGAIGFSLVGNTYLYSKEDIAKFLEGTHYVSFESPSDYRKSLSR